jgi:plasmid maintenance system antidote protein VapI
MMSDIRKKIEEIAVDDTGSWLEKARYRRDNRAWLRKSQRIAVRVLSVLNERGIQQKELAEAMDVSPQQVSKIVKGKQNLTLETISKLEAVLGVKLFEVPVPQLEMNVERKTVRTNLSKDRSTAVKSRKDLSEMNMQLWTPSTEGEMAA